MRSDRLQRHASIIFNGGKPLSFGSNDEKNHAEENAIHRLEDYFGITCKGKVILNVRITAAGHIGLSKPCPACMDLLREKKFRKVIYSTNDGTFEKIYL